jgi:hypothetical protein
MTYQFRPDIAALILDEVATGAGLKAVCEKLPVDRRTVQHWAAENPEFNRALQHARREGYEVWADEILSIGDEVEGSTDNATVQAARVRIDSRKWLLAKLNPERYGDKVELTGAGGRDLLAAAPETQIPRLMQVLAIMLPGMPNGELHSLATTMAGKLLRAPTSEIPQGPSHDEIEITPPGFRDGDRPH